MTDAGGDTALRDLGLFRASQLIRFSYYTPELVFNILVPFGYIRIGHYDESSSGLGDIWAGGGGFLPVREVDLLLMVNAKFPTGEYDSGKSVNFGSNQFDVGPALFIHRTWGDFSLDGAVKYYFKLENRSTETDPGDDLHLQALFGYEIVPGVKIGPGVNWLLGGNRKVNGRTVPSSARELLSVGGEVYVKLPPVSVTVNYLNEIYSENAPRGHFSKIKLCYKF